MPSLPPPAGGTQLYRKVRDRASYAFALVSVAAVIRAGYDPVLPVMAQDGAHALRLEVGSSHQPAQRGPHQNQQQDRNHQENRAVAMQLTL